MTVFWRQALLAVSLTASLGLYACGESNNAQEQSVGEGTKKDSAQAPLVRINPDPFPSSYKPLASQPTIITNTTILDGIGGRLEGASVVIEEGKITAVGQMVPTPEGAVEIDGAGKWLTPGIIDVHSHLGVYPAPDVAAHWEGNEMTSPNTAEVWAEHSVWPQDPGFQRALAGGVTTLQILPGSANLFGGRSVVLKNIAARTVQEMKFPGAPYGLKMACGENPKRVYGFEKNTAPSTRMGNVAGYRQAWAKAQGYKRQWEKYYEDYESGEDPAPPARDLQLETLAGVLSGDIIVHMHCYRADDMGTMLDVMKEFDYHIGTFHHAVEAYKIADKLAEAGTCAAMWADWWGFKMEAYDGIRENIPFMHDAGGCAIVHSDSPIGIQRLNQEAAKAWAVGNETGLNISQEEAWTWLAINPAKSLGIDKLTGSVEVGKSADLVLWDGDPFSVYTKAETVFVDGALVYDRLNPESWPVSDFELGQVGEGDVK